MDASIFLLKAHDVVRFTEEGPQHMLTADPAKHPLIPGLVVVTVDNVEEPLTMPEHTRVIVIAAPRTATVPCLLCRECFTVPVDLGYEGMPRIGVCGPCNTRTTQAVIADRY